VRPFQADGAHDRAPVTIAVPRKGKRRPDPEKEAARRAAGAPVKLTVKMRDPVREQLERLADESFNATGASVHAYELIEAMVLAAGAASPTFRAQLAECATTRQRAELLASRLQ